MKNGDSEYQQAFALAVARGAVERAKMLAQSGGVYSTAQAARRLGLSDRANLKSAKFKILLRLTDPKSGSVVFPVFQFARDGSGQIPGLREVIHEMRELPVITDWMICNFLLARRDSLAGKNPLELLRRGKAEKVVALAAAYTS